MIFWHIFVGMTIFLVVAGFSFFTVFLYKAKTTEEAMFASVGMMIFGIMFIISGMMLFVSFSL